MFGNITGIYIFENMTIVVITNYTVRYEWYGDTHPTKCTKKNAPAENY